MLKPILAENAMEFRFAAEMKDQAYLERGRAEVAEQLARRGRVEEFGRLHLDERFRLVRAR
jgi:hypothetical protein